MLLRAFIGHGRSVLKPLYPEDEAASIVFVLCRSLIGTERYTHITEPSYEISDEKLSLLQAALSRLADGEPLQYILGKADFYGREFRVNPDVLIPRPETELLCRIALEEMAKRSKAAGKTLSSGWPKILDLCTGSGCIAWTMALEIPESEVVGVDISDAALRMAASQDFDCKRRPLFLKADILDSQEMESELFCGGFDLILSNPPYVMEKEKQLMARNVLDYEPSSALFVPDMDPLVFYHAVAKWAEKRLSPDGVGLVEINEALGEDTAAVFASSGFLHTEILKDFSGKNRFVKFSK